MASNEPTPLTTTETAPPARRQRRPLRDDLLPFLLAAAGFALAFYMVYEGFEANGGWLAVITALLGAVVASFRNRGAAAG